MITGAVYEFNMQSTNTAKGDLVSYDASERQLVYYIDKKIIRFYNLGIIKMREKDYEPNRTISI